MMGAGCLIITIAMLIVGGIALALDVSIGVALLIILGILAFLIIIRLILSAIKSDTGRGIIAIIALILIIALCLFVLVKCWGEATKDDGSWDKCMKCGGDGKYTNDLGYSVKCSRCNGVGYLP